MSTLLQAVPPRPLGLLPGAPAPATSVRHVRSLYVHIPFCERKCEYCDFTSVAGTAGQREYTAALCDELRTLGRLFPVSGIDTVFVGGGTPSLLEPELLAAVMDTIYATFPVAPDAEVTLEANPSSTSRDRATAWLRAGFNRVSIGVQSLEADVLRFLGRVHDPARALAAVDEVRQAGFASVNCDLIYAVPGLGDARWRRTLERVVRARPDHISCYELTVEPATPLHTSVRRGLVSVCDADVALAQHRIALETLEAAGYAQYEVSNFAREGHACRHNLAYWQNDHYIAAGVGAHGHLPAAAVGALDVEPADAVAVRYWHGRGIGAFVAAVRSGRLPIRDLELIDAETQERERVMLGLRLRRGVRITDDAMRREAYALAEAGLVDCVENHGCVTRTTRRGESVLNAVISRLVSCGAH
jgi:putative oxygen-independent coproporphyrinogen III oxidase